MKTRKVGMQGVVVSALGLGGVGMSESYSGGDDWESIATIHRALELGGENAGGKRFVASSFRFGH